MPFSLYFWNQFFLQGAQQSKMLEGIPSDLYLAMQTEPLVYNSHNFCIKPDWFTGISSKSHTIKAMWPYPIPSITSQFTSIASIIIRWWYSSTPLCGTGSLFNMSSRYIWAFCFRVLIKIKPYPVPLSYQCPTSRARHRAGSDGPRTSGSYLYLKLCPRVFRFLVSTYHTK